jgi:hypothetical protein
MLPAIANAVRQWIGYGIGIEGLFVRQLLKSSSEYAVVVQQKEMYRVGGEPMTSAIIFLA